jgi:uncharacterized protein YdeI (YjbR/CyaY-like superfamily)
VQPLYFAAPAELREWLSRHHEDETELIVGYHKRGTGRPSLTWTESVDEAICFGWIDGIRRRVDDERYQIRFTPRKTGSIWSAVNIAKVAELTVQNRMTPAGVRAFAARRTERSGIYSHEQRADAALTEEQITTFQADAAAWQWYCAQPPWYRRATAHWVLSAKQQTTRDRRFGQLVADSVAGRNVAPLIRRTGKD